MIIGITGSFISEFESLQYLFPMILKSLERSGNRICYLPKDYRAAPIERRVELARDFLRSVDVVFGLLDIAVLRARATLGRNCRYFILVLGSFSRGAIDFECADGLLWNDDVFLCNSNADIELVGRFFLNAQTALLHFPCPDLYFDCLLPKAEARRKWALSKDSRVILYTGRLTLEKNIQMLFRLCAMVVRDVPDCVLLLAGRIVDTQFYDLGIVPANLSKTFMRVVGELGIERNVRFLGKRSREELSELYSAADVFATMSLHHDENFGLSPVEAMASGIPVITTEWGGFRDTVVHGLTGFRVPVLITQQAPILDWVESYQFLSALLINQDLRYSMGTNAKKHAIQHFQEKSFIECLRNILSCRSETRPKSEKLCMTDFAKGVWASRETGLILPTEEGRIYYREILRSYAAPSQSKAGHRYTAAAPFLLDSDILFVEHPFFQLGYKIPEHLISSVKNILIQIKQSSCFVSSSSTGFSIGMLNAIEWLGGVGAILSIHSDAHIDSARVEIATASFFTEDDFTARLSTIL